MNARLFVPEPVNEPVLGYLKGSPERGVLENELADQMNKPIDIPVIIDGKAVSTDSQADIYMPTQHGKLLGKYHIAGKTELKDAVNSSLDAHKEWSEWNWEDRIAIFLKAAELLTNDHRAPVNAATMLGQGKNVFQAEIDAACELIDFFRFNSYYVQSIYQEQPNSSKGIWNQLEYRPLEGFVLAITPFNFTSIAGNLPSAPALVGNVSLWKPASSSVYSGYYLMKLFMEAGVPPGVINFIPSPGKLVGDTLLSHPDLAGVHFTGSTSVFQNMWKTIGNNIANYRSYPRIVGETGGKDFIFVHKSANVDETVTALLRGAFEYQGQKCSAASRAYIPETLWGAIRERLVHYLKDVIKMGDVTDFSALVNAVIDRASFDNIKMYIDFAKSHPSEYEIIAGGNYDDSVGYFVEPTVIKAEKPDARLLCEEIFGPVLTIYQYKDHLFEETLKICDSTSPYALTGSIFAKDRGAVITAKKILRFAAGNFYINDKPTGAVVGQQPFGGARASGTNDKAGSPLNLLRWLSPRTIKETFDPPKSPLYPYML